MTVIRVAASTAIRDIVAGSRAHGVVHAVFEHATYVTFAGGRLVAIVTRDGVHQPSAAVVPWTADRRPATPGVQAGAPVVAADGAISIAGVDFRPGRWWEPQPTVRHTERSTLANAAADIAGRLAPLDEDVAAACRELQDALADGDIDGSRRAARRLLGRGPGLTPFGDDVLAGCFGTTAALASALDDARSQAVSATTRATATHILDEVEDATTTISAGLLRDASRGALAQPVAHLLTAAAAGAPVAGAVAAVLRIGATSGAGLLHGCVLALDVLVDGRAEGHARMNERQLA